MQHVPSLRIGAAQLTENILLSEDTRLVDVWSGMIRLLILTLLYLELGAGHAPADDTIFTSTAEIKKEAARFGDEALEVVKTPLDTKNYGLIGTLAVAGAVGLTYVFDDDIRDKVQGNKSGTLEIATDIGNIVGNPFVHLGIAAVVYGGGAMAGSSKWRETGEMLGEAALLADATGFLLKEAIGRGRPFAANDKGRFRPFQFDSDYDSMPSLHTASSFAMASVMAFATESITAKLSYYTAASFVGFSRIYQDKHWTSDAVLGAALGELCGRVVTGYHARGGRVALVPVVDGNSALVVMQGKW